MNDVLMTLMCLTLRKYFQRYEPSTLKQSVTATIPVSVRREGEEDIFNPMFFGNNFSQAQISFPLEVEDPMEAFRRVKSQIDVIKVSPEPHLRLGLISCLTSCAVPQSLLASAMMDQFGRVTATLSNVIGPLREVQFLGQAVDDLSFYAMVPLGLYLGVVQYKGRIKVGMGQNESPPGIGPQVLVHVSICQDNSFWGYPIFASQPGGHLLRRRVGAGAYAPGRVLGGSLAEPQGRGWQMTKVGRHFLPRPAPVFSF